MNVFLLKRGAALLAALAVFALAACGNQAEPGAKGTVTVSSKMDTEGALLGQMIKQVLEANDFAVADRIQLGGTDIVRKALLAGEIDLYPEYTGNGAFFFNEADSEVWKDAAKAWQRVKELDRQANGLVWLPAAPANNTWAIAVRRDLAEASNLNSLSDLAAYLGKAGAFKLAASEEFVSSPAALPAFGKAYGFNLRADQVLVLSGGNTATTEKAAAEGTDGVNAAMAYGTDGQLAALNLLVLQDDLRVQPVYEPAPVLRAEVAEKYPEIETLLAPVFAKLDLVTLQGLNASIAVEGKAAADVAGAWLRQNSLLP